MAQFPVLARIFEKFTGFHSLICIYVHLLVQVWYPFLAIDILCGMEESCMLMELSLHYFNFLNINNSNVRALQLEVSCLGNIHSPAICIHFQVFNSDYLVTNLVLLDILTPFGRNILF